MHRTVVVAIGLGLGLAGLAAAQEAASRAEARAATQASVREVAVESARGNRPSAFSYPSGLSMSAECLFERLGHCPGHCLPMTSDTTFDLAYACFIRGMYEDAIVFASHGLKLREDARLYLIKGVCEMHVGRCFDAEATAEQYQKAVDNRNLIGLTIARERVNGPMRVRFEQVLKHIAASDKSVTVR